MEGAECHRQVPLAPYAVQGCFNEDHAVTGSSKQLEKL